MMTNQNIIFSFFLKSLYSKQITLKPSIEIQPKRPITLLWTLNMANSIKHMTFEV